MNLSLGNRQFLLAVIQSDSNHIITVKVCGNGASASESQVHNIVLGSDG